MTAPEGYQWRRDRDGLGVWEHKGLVAVAGFGHSPVDRRWDGVAMDQTLGAYSILACRKAMERRVTRTDEGVSAGQPTSGGSASQWPPRPYQAPVGAPVAVTFEEVAPGELIHEWRVVA